jgi:hypothetical protein
MDQTIWLLVGALVVVALVATVLVLRRSWGDMPERIGVGAPPEPLTAPTQTLASDADQLASEPESNDVFGPISPEGLVQVLHPMVLRSVREAYRRGGAVTRYIVERDGHFFFDLERIPDEAERQQAYSAINALRAGNADIHELVQLVRRLTDGR